jgi:hypothetical protein
MKTRVSIPVMKVRLAMQLGRASLRMVRASRSTDTLMLGGNWQDHTLQLELGRSMAGPDGTHAYRDPCSPGS